MLAVHDHHRRGYLIVTTMLSCSHFMDEETGTQRPSEVTQLVRSPALFPSQADTLEPTTSRPLSSHRFVPPSEGEPGWTS